MWLIDTPCEVAVLSSRTPLKCNHTTTVVSQSVNTSAKKGNQVTWIRFTREKLFAIGLYNWFIMMPTPVALQCHMRLQPAC